MSVARNQADLSDSGLNYPLSEFKATPWAWGICWLMFASTILNYMDRQAIAMVRPQIQEEFHLTFAAFGWVMAAFQLTYAVFQIPAGYVVDRWDLRRTYAGAVFLWSIAGIASAFSPTLGVLLGFRALLGAGESFNWPCALRVTSRILPPSDRSLGNGIFNSGAAVGAVVTPVFVTLLTQRYGWRVSFVVVGSLGFLWVGTWLRLIGASQKILMASPRSQGARSLDQSKSPSGGLSSAAILTYACVSLASLLIAISSYKFGLTAIWWAIAGLIFGLLLASLLLCREDTKGSEWATSLGEVVRLPRFWVLVLVSMTINVCWHFLVSWMPTYLKEDRGMTFLASGLWTAVPFLAADAGNLGGGVLSRLGANRGLGVVRSRIAVMTCCTLMIACGAFIGWAKSDIFAIVLLGIMAMGAAAFMANYFAFAQEVSSRHTGLIVGILGAVGNLAAAGIQPLAGLVKDQTGRFGPVFVLVGVLPFIGLGALLAGWRIDDLEKMAD